MQYRRCAAAWAVCPESLGEFSLHLKRASAPAALRAVKVVHTVAWALFAGCIVALPLVAWRREFTVAAVLIAIVTAEVLVYWPTDCGAHLRI